MPKKIKKGITVDQLARTTQRGFVEVDEKLLDIQHDVSGLATKEELRTTIQESEGRLLDAIKSIDVKRAEIEDLREDVKELIGRVSMLEKKR